jgi:hypothetical protein
MEALDASTAADAQTVLHRRLREAIGDVPFPGGLLV